MYRTTFRILSRSANSLIVNSAKTCVSGKRHLSLLPTACNLKPINTTSTNFVRHFSSSSGEELEKEFQTSVANLEKVTVDVDNEQKLQLYALYKQASIGECNQEKPSMYNVVQKAKWQAWKSLGDISMDEAKRQYIAVVSDLLKASGQVAEAAEPELVFEEKDHVFFIRLNRPKKFNAITPEIYNGIIGALKRSAEDPDIKFTVITGTGKYFSSGNDLQNFTRMAKEFDGDMQKSLAVTRDMCQKFVAAFIDYPKVLIGAVNGPAYGIMFTTLGLYDVVLATDDALFTCPFSSLGQSPEGCSTHTFPKLFGTSLASELLYLNYKMPVTEAHRLGFVSRIVPKENFQSHLDEWLYGEKGLVNTCYPNSMLNAKNIVRNEETRLLLHQINKTECDVLQQSWTSEECMQALSKFYNRK